MSWIGAADFMNAVHDVHDCPAGFASRFAAHAVERRAPRPDLAKSEAIGITLYLRMINHNFFNNGRVGNNEFWKVPHSRGTEAGARLP
jgi:hypothetical protein